jgi:creatinine amidohydrolase
VLTRLLLAAALCTGGALDVLGAQAPAPAAPPPRTRAMDNLNWMEFRELVPSRIHTVILTVGTLEPHGVANNGADNTAPVAIAAAIAGEPGINALLAPHIPYGVTGSLTPYPGALTIPEPAFRAYVHAVLEGLAKNRFRDIIIVNGHGGPQTAILNDVAREVSLARDVNTLVINWWSLTTDISREVFGSDGGHAGVNETAFIQAIDPELVRRERYTGPEMATANPAPGAWSAVPFPSAITLYQPGSGWPTDFDQAKAERYHRAVIARVRDLVRETIAKWRMAGF